MNNIFDNTNIQKLGRTLVKIAAIMPEYIVKKTPFMVWVFKLLSRLANTTGKMSAEHKQNIKVAKLLNYENSQHNVPWVAWMHRDKYKVPLVLATWEQKVEYNTERRKHQVIPEITAHIKYAFQGGTLQPSTLPNDNLTWWLRETLLNTPSHWYTVSTEVEGSDKTEIELNFSTFCDEVEHESSNCKYNVRDIIISAKDEVSINLKSELNSLERLTMTQQDADPRHLQHASFLTLTLLQQACQATYHNWIHFYFNDFVLLYVQSHIPTGHWVRDLLDPHMRYQTVLNNAGLFSRLPNDIQSNELYDDILFGANLSSWSLDTFQKNIADKGLGYFIKAEHSKACNETNKLNFNLNKSVENPDGHMQILVNKLENEILSFVGRVIDHCATKEDEKLMGLISDNTLKFLDKDCLKGITPENDNVKGRFKLVISRYILQAGIVHGLEHHAMYFWLSPLHLPQRIRKFFNVNLSLEDYCYDIDKSNGYFGHRLFTKYVPNEDNQYNWSSLDYSFKDHTLKKESQAFVAKIQQLIEEYDQTVLAPAREILEENNIPVDEHCYLTPQLIGTSICM